MKKYLILINKDNKIKKNYFKNIKLIDTKLVDNTPCQIEEETYKTYLELKKKLAAENIEIGLDSAYRTIEKQQEIYNEYQEKYGLDYTSKIVAEPFTSEHHTGLAIDLSLKVNFFMNARLNISRYDKNIFSFATPWQITSIVYKLGESLVYLLIALT